MTVQRRRWLAAALFMLSTGLPVGLTWADGTNSGPPQAAPAKKPKKETPQCPTPTNCPPDGFVDCMPGSGPIKCACVQRKWVEEHCPKVQFAD